MKTVPRYNKHKLNGRYIVCVYNVILVYSPQYIDSVNAWLMPPVCPLLCQAAEISQ